MCMSYTDVAQVANAASNYEILHERDDEDNERLDKRLGVPLRATLTQYALLMDVDTKGSVVELQADKKPGASGRVFAITEGHAA
nr:hypothetical protein [Tanacetum cinerariifolium]